MPTKKIHNARSNADLKALLISEFLALSPLTIAEKYTDELSECLLSTTYAEDELSLSKWMFTAIGLHSAVGDVAGVSLSAPE
tara:strand:- start:276 stop:521 length:246 start_codon:yes stop_codon:yes gene_type:complete